MKKLSIALILALALVLSGCSMLREDGAPAQEDRLVGIYITPEYVDTFDFSSYAEDNASSLINGGEISSEDAAEYSQRVYATDNGGREGHIEFPMWGIPSSPRAMRRTARAISATSPATIWTKAACTSIPATMASAMR